MTSPREIPSYPTHAGTLVEWGNECWLGPFGVIGLRPMANAANRRPIDNGPPLPVTIGDRTIIGAHCTIYRDVQMGEDCRLGDYVNIREGARIGKRCVVGTYSTVQYGCLIGDDVRIIDHVHVAGGTVIGDKTFIGPGVQSANDPYIAKFSLDDYKDRGLVPPVIGRRVFIGMAATLLPGVVIGDDAVVGARANVTKNVPAGMFVLGNPARIVRPATEDDRLKVVAESAA